MSAIKTTKKTIELEALAELQGFLDDFSTLLAAHLTSVRNILRSTVDQAMNGVTDIDQLVASHISHAQTERIFKDHPGLVDFKNTIAAQKADLEGLESEVRARIHEMIGGLSIDDVVRQRLDHISLAIKALIGSLQRLFNPMNGPHADMNLSLAALQYDLLSKMYHSFTIEDEKLLFKQVFGLIEGINKKSS